MEDRVSLDGIMMKCNQNPTKLEDSAECENARIAIDRLASQTVDPTVEQKRQEEFEKAREKLRLEQDKLRQEQEAKTKVDAYSLPVVPVDPQAHPATTTPGTPAATSSTQPAAVPGAAVAGTTTP